MDRTALMAALRASVLGEICSQATLEMLLSKSEVAQFRHGRAIFRAGDDGAWFYVLISGKVITTSAFEHTLGSSSQPGYIGGLAGVVRTAAAGAETHERATHSVTHTAATDVTALKITADAVRAISATQPDFTRAVLQHLATRLASKNSRVAELVKLQKAGDAGGAGAEAIYISVFDTKAYDMQNLAQRFAGATVGNKKVELHFVAAKLDLTTAPLAAGSAAVCIFVNDTCDAKVLRALKSIGVNLVLLRCAGFNCVDIVAAQELGVSVARVPAYSPRAVAEHAAALLLGVTRRTYLAYDRVRSGNFTLDGLEGRDLHGLTCGVVGTGKIGRCFAEIAKGFGMKVLLWDAYPLPDFAKAIGGEYVADFHELVSKCDVISLHVPLLPETHHLFGAKALAHAKPGLVIVNTSRGPVVDAKVLLDGILAGKLGGAGLDVYENEKEYFFEDRSATAIADSVLARLVNLPNVLVTSHQAFLTSNALAAIGDTTRLNALEYFRDGKRGKQLTNAVVPMPPASKL